MIGKIIGDVLIHDHAADVASIECNKLKTKIKKLAENTNDNLTAVVASTFSNVSFPAAPRLPKPESMVRTVQRRRQTDKPELPNPQNRF